MNAAERRRTKARNQLQRDPVTIVRCGKCGRRYEEHDTTRTEWLAHQFWLAAGHAGSQP